MDDAARAHANPAWLPVERFKIAPHEHARVTRDLVDDVPGVGQTALDQTLGQGRMEASAVGNVRCTGSSLSS